MTGSNAYANTYFDEWKENASSYLLEHVVQLQFFRNIFDKS